MNILLRFLILNQWCGLLLVCVVLSHVGDVTSADDRPRPLCSGGAALVGVHSDNWKTSPVCCEATGSCHGLRDLDSPSVKMLELSLVAAFRTRLPVQRGKFPRQVRILDLG